MKWLFRHRFLIFECLVIGICVYFFMGNIVMLSIAGAIVGFVSISVQSALGLDRTAKEKKV